MSGFTEDQIKGMVREEVRDYFRMSRPGFEITSNSYTLGHGQSEFCLSTDSGQGMHFYKQGNCKMLSSKSFEIYSGAETGKKTTAIVIDADNGDIYIKAENGDLILEGKNVKIQATDASGTISLNSPDKIYNNAPNLKFNGTNVEIIAKFDMSFMGGNTSIHSEMSSLEMSNGDDAILNGDIMDKLLNVSDIIKRAKIWAG